MSESLAVRSPGSRIRCLRARMATYMELTKPRLTLLAILTTFLGFYLGSSSAIDYSTLINVVFAAALVGGGANTLNQFFERETDARMKRTENRPLPSGRLNEEQAFNFGLVLSVVGVLYFAFFVHPLSSLMALAVLVTYLLLYTPLKRKSGWAVFVGAVPGALPPVMGWTAARDSFDLEVGILFAILFLWQLPHFLAIAWVHREDYKMAGFPMLACRDENGKETSRQIAFYCALLLPVSLVPFFLRMTGSIYLVSSLFLGLIFLGLALGRILWEPRVYAKRFFLASIIYLPVLIVLMIVDKI